MSAPTETSGEGPVDPRQEVIGIPDASFGEEYGGLGRPEPDQGGGSDDGSGTGGRERVARNTAIFSIATGVSRVVGLAREVVAASFFGTKGPISAFTIAFQIPNLVSNLFANAALSAAFVPVFTDLLQQGRKREAFRLASTIFWIILIVLGAVTAFFVLAAGLIMPLFTGPTFDAPLDAFTVAFSQILFPVVLLIGLTGLFVGILQSYEHFTIPAIAPAVWNLVIIVLLVVLRGHFHGGYEDGNQVYAYAIAILVATFVQTLMVFGALRRIDFRLQVSIDWHDPRIKQVFTLMLPVTIGLGIVNLDQLINSVFGTLVNKEAPRAIDNAFRIYMLPQGLFSVAVATVLFPTLSRMAARHDAANMRRTIGIGMRQINLLLIPSAVFMLVLSTPIVRLVFERGQFNAQSTHLVSEALFWFAISLPFGGLNLLLTRVFFSVQRPWIPTRLAALNIIVDIIVSHRSVQAAGDRRADHRHGRGQRGDDRAAVPPPADRLQRPVGGRADDHDHRAHPARLRAAGGCLLGRVDAPASPAWAIAPRPDRQRRRGGYGRSAHVLARGLGDAHPRGPPGQPPDPHPARAGLKKPDEP